MKLSPVLLGLCLLAFISGISPSYSQLLLFGAKEKGKKYGFINERGEYVIAPAFDEVGFFQKGVAMVKKGKKYGIINEQGQFVVQPIYEGAQLYAPEAKFTVKKGDKWGVVDATGNIIIPFQYEYLSIFKDGYVVAGKFIVGKAYKGLVCPQVLNQNNEVVFGPGVFDPEEHDCSQLFLPARADKVSGNYSAGWPMVRDGWLILKEAWEGVDYAQYKPIEIRSGTGQTFSQEFTLADSYYGFREGCLAMSKVFEPEESVEGQKYITTETGLVVPENAVKQGLFMDTATVKASLMNPLFSDSENQYDATHPYFNGVASVEKNGNWAFIDRDGWIINETQLSVEEYRAYPPMYFNGLIGFFRNGKAGYVDIKGKEVIPFNLDEYHPFEFNVTPVKKNGLYGLIRKDGSWAVQPKYEELSLLPCPCYQ